MENMLRPNHWKTKDVYSFLSSLFFKKLILFKFIAEVASMGKCISNLKRVLSFQVSQISGK